MLSQGIAKKTYVVVTALVTVLTMVIGYWYMEAQRDLVKANIQRNIVLAASELEQKIDDKMFHDKVAAVLSLPISEDEMAQKLNQWLQPILMEIAQKRPDYQLGIYSRQIDRIVAIGPNYAPGMLVQLSRPESLRVYDTATPVFAELVGAIDSSEKDALNVAYPIVYGGRVIGHTWASQKTQDIDAIMRLTIAKISGAVIAIWLLAILCLGLIFTRLENALVRLAEQIKTQDDSCETFEDLPELLPVFETIIQLREDLKKEHNEKNRINLEIARLDRLNLIGEMAAGVAHEIRNPMTVIMGFIQMISRKAPDTTKEQLEIVMTELKRVNSIVADFLSLAKNKRVEKSRCDLNLLIQSMYPLIYEDCAKKSISLELQLAERMPELFVDDQEIRQLVLNLCRNAIEAICVTGKIVITTKDYRGYIRLTVADNGEGIAADLLNKVFDPFYTTKAAGTGLGLSICKSIVDRHQGELLVESKTGRGTRAVIKLPKITDPDFYASTWQ